MTSPAETRLDVDLDAVAANYHTVRAAAGGAEVAPALKADAYGLGAGPVGRRLWAEGARRFFVARLSEGQALRAELGGRDAEILVLDGCTPGSAGAFAAHRLTPVLNSRDQVAAWRAAAVADRSCALHVDTGINRLGLRPEEARDLGSSAPDLPVALVMSHLACASDPAHPMNAVQAERFAEVAGWFPDARASLANSAGVFLGEAFRFDLVRPGISLYGGGPFGRPDPRIRAAAVMRTPILQVRQTPAGESIGYGAAFTADRPLSVAILAAGYADGVLRSQSPRGVAWLEGEPRRFLGRVSMDLIAIDVTGVPGAVPGALVELLGPQANVDLAAEAGGTIAYELLVRSGARARRIYSGEA